MKRLITFALLLITMTASAQTWEKKTQEADIINETPERTYYELQMDSITSVKVFADNNEWFLTTKFNRNGFKLNMKMFQVQVREIQTHASFAFFDANGNVAQPTLKNIRMTATDRAQTIGSGKWTEKDAEKVSVYLKTANGCVQIVAQLHMGGEYKAKIPCIQSDIQ